MVTRCHLLSFVVTRCHRSFVVPLVANGCISLSLVVPLVLNCYHLLYHSLSLVLALVVIRCHLLSFVATSCTSLCHSLSLDVPLVCHFINDQILTSNLKGRLILQDYSLNFITT